MSDSLDKLFSVQVFEHGEVSQREDYLSCEFPIAIEINGITQAVMMATPQQLEDFAVGFCLSEGIVDSANEIYGIEQEQREQGIVLALEIATQRQQQLAERRRHMAGRTGCGLCGIDSLDAIQTCDRVMTPQQRFNHAIIQQAQVAFNNVDAAMLRSGTMHQASWINTAGELRHLCLDVGRHNALDKLIGWRARQGVLDGFAMLSSRASHELVEKCATVGIEMLVCVSGATSLAVTRARHLNITLVGFARAGRHVVYAGNLDNQ